MSISYSGLINDAVKMTDEELQVLKDEIREVCSLKLFSRLIAVPYGTLTALLNGFIPMREKRLAQIRASLEEAKNTASGDEE